MARIVRAARHCGGLALLCVAMAAALSAAAGAARQTASEQPPADRAQTQALSRRAAARIAALQKEADALAARERPLLDELRRLEVNRELRTEQAAQVDRDLAVVRDDLASTGAALERLESRSRAELPGLTTRMVELYKLGQGGYVRMLLNVDDLREAGRAYRLVSGLQQMDRDRAAEHRRTRTELRTARQVLETRQARLVALQADALQARAAAEQASSAQSTMVQQIDQRRDLAAQLAGELQVVQQRLQARLAALDRGSAPGAALALPFKSFRGDFDWPLDGRIITVFGRQRNARFNTATVSNGIRVSAAAGTPVHAVHEGTVVFAEAFSGFGNLLIIDHGSQAFTMYGSLDTIGVGAGTRVSRGQAVGTSGAAMDGTPSIYFEVRIDGRPVDPLQWLKKR